MEPECDPNLTENRTAPATPTVTSPPPVVVYGRPGCVQCAATTRQMTRLGIDYLTIDVDTDAGAAQSVRDLGYLALPVVVTTEGHWSGFRPDGISALADRATRAA